MLGRGEFGLGFGRGGGHVWRDVGGRWLHKNFAKKTVDPSRLSGRVCSVVIASGERGDVREPAKR